MVADPMRLPRELRPALIALAPNVLALLVAGAGVMLLTSGATPSDPVRFMWLAEHAPLVLIEISHFVSSVLGVVLVMLAFGLSRRLFGAWAASGAVLAAAAAPVLLLAVGVWRLLATAATPRVVGEDDPDFARVRAILAVAEAAEPGSNLALLGDKRFLFSTSGRTFLMFGVRGRSWIALGAPVGCRAERDPR